MDDRVRSALRQGGIIDLTTTGRRTGQARRIEIALHVIDGRYVISGMPIAGRTRAWIRNIEAEPRVTIHLKRGLSAAVRGTARVVVDEDERRELLERVARAWRRTDIEAMVAHSPLIEITFDEAAAAA